jgi:hypothetical protein
MDNKLKAALALITSATSAYVLGGIVLALRLSQAHFPVQDSLNVMPFQTILVTGVRELLISTIVAVVLAGVMLGVTVLPILPDLIGTAGIPLALLAFVPLNAGGIAWIIGLAVVGWLIRWLLGAFTPYRVMVTAGVFGITVIGVTLARYMVPPYRFPRGEVLVKVQSRSLYRTETYSGGYLTETSDFVYLAYQDVPRTREDEAAVVGYPRSDVVALTLRSPPDPGTPPRSIIRLLGGPRIAFTPLLDVWRNGSYHGLRLFR